MSAKLRECPFCELEENLVIIKVAPIEYLNNPNLDAIHCDNCGLTVHHPDKEMMYKIWNTRHEPKHETVEQWVSVKDKLPEIDEYVLWIWENGFIFYECIDKDWDRDIIEMFLGGYKSEIHGPITHWMKPLPIVANHHDKPSSEEGEE